MKRGIKFLCFSIILILVFSFPFASAGFFSDLWNKITGRATGLTCTDSDSSLLSPAYYSVKGNACLSDGKCYEDYCASAIYLKEAACSGDSLVYKSYICSTTCEDGICRDCTVYYYDSDGDGYGTSINKCLGAITGNYRATNTGDCNDNDANINPSKTETCGDSLDNDCDGMIDEGCAEVAPPSYSVSRGDIIITGCIDEDANEDFYGSHFVSSRSCLTFIQGGNTEILSCIPDYCVGEENPRLLKEAECRGDGSQYNPYRTSYYDSTCDIRCENGACVRTPVPDTTPPTIRITYPNSGIQSSPPDTFSFVASDDIGLSLCQYSLDGGTTKNDSSCEASIHGLQPAVGSHTWIVYATDTSGNTATQSVTFIVEEAKTSVPEVVTPPCQGTDTDCYNRETGACDDCTAIPAGLLTCDILGDIAGYKFRCSNRGCVGKAFREKITDCNYGCFRYEINDARCLAQPEEGDEVFTIGSPHRSWCPNGYYCSNQRPWFCWEQRCCYAGQQTPGCN